MTTVHDIADVVRIIREQPEWADTIRSILLSRELLELPQRFAEYAEATNQRLERLETALAEFVESTNRRLEALEGGQAKLEEGQARLEGGQAKLEEGQARLEGRQAKLEEGQARLEGRQAKLEEGQARLEGRQAKLEEGQARLEGGQAKLEEGQARLEGRQAKLEEGQARLEGGQAKLEEGQARLEGRQAKLEEGQAEIRADMNEMRSDISAIREDLRPLKASHARNGAERGTRRIARTMNCFQVRLLNSDDLHRLFAGIDSNEISRSDRDSFEDADIVIVGEHRETGETHYIAVEASFTAHEDDTRRAIRNADYLARSTGQPAHAVVASRVIDPTVESVFTSGRVHWYEIPLRHLESD